MSSKIKKILIIIGIILTLTFIVALVYYFFFKEATITTAPPGSDIIYGGEDGIMEQDKQRLISITEESVLGGSVASENGKIVYLALDGNINKINYDGTEKTKIGVMSVDGIGEVSISKSGKNILTKLTSQSGIVKYIVYNTEKNSLKSLPEKTVTASLDPAGENAAIATSGSPTGTKISSINLSSGETTDITTTKIPDIVLDWHNSETIAIKTRPSGLAFGILYNLDVKTKNISRILGNVNGLTSLFSPSSKKALVSETSYDGKNLSFGAINIEKDTKQGVNILTLPEKCVWFSDDRTVICASINAENKNKYIMPDDYYKGAVKFTSEDILRINLDTGQTQKLINGVFDAQNLFLSKDESYLFFINKIDGRLYRLTL
jgi:hypothetical protein